jgi:hypothetical protein
MQLSPFPCHLGPLRSLRGILPSRTKIFITASRCELRGWNPYRSNGFFSFLRGTDRLWGQSSLIFKENRCSFPGVNPPVRKVYHLLSPSVEVEVEWRYGLEEQRFESQHDQKLLLSCKPSISVLGPAEPPLQCLPGFLSKKKPFAGRSWQITFI